MVERSAWGMARLKTHMTKTVSASHRGFMPASSAATGGAPPPCLIRL